MRPYNRPESRQDIPNSPRSRSSSISSSVASPTGRTSGILAVPFPPNPLPAYVAASSASESVQTAISERLLGQDVGVVVVFADAALAQVNSFLDTLLYNVLANARSSTLTRIKPAVDVVVRGALGQRAIASAEQELEDLLGDGEDDDEIDIDERERDSHSAWDLDFVFRRTRLRLMVYMSLATMDDDEEERHVEEHQLHSQPGEESDRFSQRTGLVSWKALMFLTAVLEYVAEACLKDAGHFAFSRASISRPNEDNSTSGTASIATSADDRLTITEADVRKLNLSPSLGRLWRSWKKVSATPTSGSPNTPQHAWQSALALRRTSVLSQGTDDHQSQRRPVDALGVTEDPVSTYELPRRPNSDQTPARRSPLHVPKRSRSFIRFPVAIAPSTGAGSWQGSWHSRNSVEPVVEAPRSRHVRSSSLPPPTLSVFTMPPRARTDDTPASATDVASRREAMIIGPSAPHIAELMRAEKAAAKAESAEKTVQESELAPHDTPSSTVPTPRVVPQVETVEEEVLPKGEEPTPLAKPVEAIDAAEPVQAAKGDSHSKAPVGKTAEPIESDKRDNPEPAPVIVAPTSPGPDDDEYDPFRADAPAPSPKIYKPTSPQPSKSASPQPSQPASVASAKPAQKYVFEEEEDSDASTRRSKENVTAIGVGAGAALGAGVAAGTVAAAAAQLRKREKPAPIDLPKKDPRSPQAVSKETPPAKPTAQATGPALQPGVVSPLKMSPVQVSDYQSHSATTTHGMPTPDDGKTSDVFVTPPRSPVTAATPEESVPQAKSPPTNKSLPPRPEAAASKHGKHNGLTGSAGDRVSAGSASGHSEREFNDMVAGKDTVKRSLTPRNLSEIEQPNSSVRRQEAVKSIVVPHDSAPPEAPPIKNMPSTQTAAAAAAATAAMTTSRVETVPKPGPVVTNVQRSSPTASEAAYVPRSPRWTSPTQLSSKPSKSGLTARESRVKPSGNTAELADFLRSTAPDRPLPQVKPFVPSSTPAEDANSATSRPTVGKINTGSAPLATRPMGAAKMLNQLRGGRNERQGNDDLIAFLNDGPPGAHVNKTRSMETTGSSVNAGFSPQNRSGSPTSHAPSFNESINSHSNLIGGGRRGGSNPALAAAESPRSPAAQPGRQPAAPPKQMGGAPVRKQRRVKDPYAIDDDEDEEEDDVLMGLPNKREEQGMSMIDFLRSSEPPPAERGARGQRGATGSTTSKPAVPSKDVYGGAGSRAATSSPGIPDFLREPSRAPSARSSRDSFGSAFGKGDKSSRRSSVRSTESKSRFSFFRKVGVSG